MNTNRDAPTPPLLFKQRLPPAPSASAALGIEASWERTALHARSRLTRSLLVQESAIYALTALLQPQKARGTGLCEFRSKFFLFVLTARV